MRFLLIRLNHLLFWPRMRTNAEIRRFARTQSGRVLEVGSGPPRRGRYPYSAARMFDCDVTRSDIDPGHGHKVVDVTKDDLTGFDAILCANVLEHVYDYGAAIHNVWKCLPDGGTFFVVVPFLQPLHAEPRDFWRFTEHALRLMFDQFGAVEVRHRGLRGYPVIYSVTATKGAMGSGFR